MKKDVEDAKEYEHNNRTIIIVIKRKEALWMLSKCFQF